MLKKFITLKLLLNEMEEELGLSDLSDAEKNIYLAAQDLSSEGSYVATKDLLDHKLTQNLTRPTFFRCLKAVQTKGLLKHSARRKRGEFEVC
jgi:hypothetical protein